MQESSRIVPNRSRKPLSGIARIAIHASRAACCIYCGPQGIDPARITATVVCGVLGVAMLASGIGHHRTAADSLGGEQVALSVPVTVSEGDSLWKLAKRYGKPDGYIQDSVDAIAHANQMSSSATLLPGQRLIVPVTNPVVLARLQTRLASR